MGTRHIIAVVKDGELKISQYGQWDGYFSCKGVEFVDWVRENLKRKEARAYEYVIEKFKQKLDCCKPVPNEWVEKFYTTIKQFSIMGDDKEEFAIPVTQLMPMFHRDTSIKMLDLIADIREYEYNSEPKKFYPVQIETDTCMIEYIYVLDMDKECIYCLTSHEFNKSLVKQVKLPAIITETFVDFDLFYSSSIKGLPTSDRIVKKLEPLDLCL